MRIALEARALSRPASGIKTYVQGLRAALLRVAADNQYEVLDQGSPLEALWPLWLNTTVPKWLREVTPDVVHFTKAAIPRRKQYPTVVTIYDVIPLLFPQSQKLLPRLLWPKVLHHAATTADHILTISEASKTDIVRLLNVAPEKITVTKLAVSSSPSPKLGLPAELEGEGRVRYEGQTPYILFLGTIEPRKNVPALVRAFVRIAHDIPHALVIAGRAYKGSEEVREEIRKGNLENRVEIRDFVSQEELPALYAGAALFVLPSIYEGWGFPAQEAMAAGVPVIVSTGGSLPEVVGAAGEIVPFIVDTVAERTHDEAFEAALADRMRAVLTDSAQQVRMREAGFLQVQKFSWDDVAKKTLDVYHRVV